MIENKQLSFIQKNTIENRWALLKKAELHIPVNPYYCEIVIQKDTSRAIVSSEEIRLVLSEPCLSMGITADLRWVCKYGGIKLRLVAKNEQIAAKYSYLSFTEVRIDPDICINYMGIHGKEPLYLAIGEDYTETNDAIEKYYFDRADNKASFIVPAEAERVLILDERGEFNDEEFFSACRKRNIEIDHIVSSRYFNREIAEKFPPHVALFVSERVTNGILSIEKSGRIRLYDIKTGCPFSDAENVHSYFGALYFSPWREIAADPAEIPSDAYICEGGKVRHLSIAPEKVIKTELYVATMDDFVAERFDRSMEDAHDDYCLEAFRVRYDYTLVPPLYGDDYPVSSIYDGAKAIFREWPRFRISVGNFIDALKEIDRENELLHVCGHLTEMYEKLMDMIENDEYSGFHETVRNGIAIVGGLLSRYTEEWMNIFRAINGQDSGKKFDRFDREIAGYQETIAEKQKLVDQGVEVLSNKRRIEVLTRKIADLEHLKAGFAGTSSSRDAKAEEEFAKLCNSILNGGKRTDEDAGSLGNVIKQAELTSTKRLEKLAAEWLLPLRDHFTDIKDVLAKLSGQDFPETYRIYEKSGQRYIAIDDLKEYEATKAMRDRYRIQCLARREKQ